MREWWCRYHASTWAIIIRLLLLLTSTTKLKKKKADYEPSKKSLDCTHEFASCSFLETSICVNAYIVDITIFAYDVWLDCLIGFNNDALLFSLPANAGTMVQRFPWCRPFYSRPSRIQITQLWDGEMCCIRWWQCGRPLKGFHVDISRFHNTVCRR